MVTKLTSAFLSLIATYKRGTRIKDEKVSRFTEPERFRVAWSFVPEVFVLIAMVGAKECRITTRQTTDAVIWMVQMTHQEYHVYSDTSDGDVEGAYNEKNLLDANLGFREHTDPIFRKAISLESIKIVTTYLLLILSHHFSKPSRCRNAAIRDMISHIS